jgi:predicted 2-oxoglutarate/Fe(II)-dependent dioxygenase YbiX
MASGPSRAPVPDLAALGALRSTPHLTDVATAPLLTPGECAAIVAGLAEPWHELRVQATAGEGPIGSQLHRATVVPEVRRGLAHPVPGGDAGPLVTRIGERVVAMNTEVFGFTLLGIEAPVQVLRYRGESADGYVAHMDLAASRPLRKLSFSLLLSDPDDFEGGDLVFSSAIPPSRVQGTLTVFPSYLVHQVSPVTRGVRDVVVGWAIGPAFS